MSKFLSGVIQEFGWLKYKLQTKYLGLNDPRGIFPGLLSRHEGVALFKLAKSLPPNAVMVEIGCYGGLSSAYLLEGAKKSGAFLHSIDPFDADMENQMQDESNIMLADKKFSAKEIDAKLRDFGLRNFKLIRGFSFEVVKEWTKQIDLLWIDGNHQYGAVKQDYDQWEPFLKIGGIIAFHDSNKLDSSQGWSKYGWEGPTTLVNEELRSPGWHNIRKMDSITIAVKTNRRGG
jgi:hypothetical protein